MACVPLYRRVLGTHYDELPAILRRFHDGVSGGEARGTFRVARGDGPIRKLVAAILHMPRAGESVPIRLQVVVEGDRERWFRHFPDRCMATVQWANGNLLMERFGLASFSSELVVHGSRLRYEFRRAWFAGVPLPRWLSPDVDGYVDAGDVGWRVVVHILAPLIGEIVHYEGWIEPEWVIHRGS